MTKPASQIMHIDVAWDAFGCCTTTDAVTFDRIHFWFSAASGRRSCCWSPQQFFYGRSLNGIGRPPLYDMAVTELTR